MDEAGELEKYYIKEYKQNGYILTNSTNGGEKSKTFTIEIREKISKSLKKYYETNDNWNKGKIQGCYWSKETRQKQSEKMKGKNNHMYNKSIFDVWIEKYGDKEGKKKIEEWSKSKRKHTYNYNKLYMLYIIKGMKQIEIANEIGMSCANMCKIMKKFGLTELKKIK